jgi:hypothetical protein
MSDSPAPVMDEADGRPSVEGRLEVWERELLALARELRRRATADRPRELSIRFFGPGRGAFVGEVNPRGRLSA